MFIIKTLNYKYLLRVGLLVFLFVFILIKWNRVGLDLRKTNRELTTEVQTLREELLLYQEREEKRSFDTHWLDEMFPITHGTLNLIPGEVRAVEGGRAKVEDKEGRQWTVSTDTTLTVNDKMLLVINNNNTIDSINDDVLLMVYRMCAYAEEGEE